MAEEKLPQAQPFSAGYCLITNVGLRTWEEGEAHMDVILYDAIADVFGRPVTGLVDGREYCFRPSEQVFAGECALPVDNHENPETLLISRNGKRDNFYNSGLPG